MTREEADVNGREGGEFNIKERHYKISFFSLKMEVKM